MKLPVFSWILLVALLLSLLLSGCGDATDTPDATTANVPAAAPPQPAVDVAAITAQLDQLYADFWEASLQLNPMQATFIGDTRYNDQLPNFFSAEFRRQAHDFDQLWLERTQAIDASALDGQARISYDIFVRERKLSLEGERFPA